MIVAITLDIETFEQGARLESAATESYSFVSGPDHWTKLPTSSPAGDPRRNHSLETGEPVAEAYRSETLLVDGFHGMMPGQHPLRFRAVSHYTF